MATHKRRIPSSYCIAKPVVHPNAFMPLQAQEPARDRLSAKTPEGIVFVPGTALAMGTQLVIHTGEIRLGGKTLSMVLEM